MANYWPLDPIPSQFLKLSHIHTHTHTHTKVGTSHRIMVLYCTNCMCYCPTPTLHLNLALARDCAFLLCLQRNSLCIMYKRFEKWGHVLISHLHLVIPMSCLCHYTNVCPDLSEKCVRAHTHTHIIRQWHFPYMFKQPRQTPLLKKVYTPY